MGGGTGHHLFVIRMIAGPGEGASDSPTRAGNPDTGGPQQVITLRVVKLRGPRSVFPEASYRS